jgi:glycosyltransferase involved in cell wall biosynthesis
LDLASKYKLVASDWARYNSATKWVMGVALDAEDRLSTVNDADSIARSLQRLTRAARGVRRGQLLEGRERRIRERMDRWPARDLDWEAFYPGSEPRLVQKALILKEPWPGGEKGVLFVAFEDNWLRLLRYANLTRLASDYELILSPTWSPPHDLAMLLAARLWPGDVYTIMSNFEDEPAFGRLASNLRAIPLLASSWVNPAMFEARSPTEKRFDIAVIANFAKYKRHFALFRAMRDMDPKISAVLLGHGWGGRTRKNIEDEARAFGVLDRITVMDNATDALVNPAAFTEPVPHVMHSSRVSVIMSLGEGSCVVVAESLFADVPVGMIETARIGSSAFINEATGRLLRPAHIAEDLTRLIADAGSMHPRKWMLENGKSAWDSSALLNDTMRRAARAQGAPWTVDLAPMQWRPNAEYLRGEDGERLGPEYTRFADAYGIPVQQPS